LLLHPSKGRGLEFEKGPLLAGLKDRLFEATAGTHGGSLPEMTFGQAFERSENWPAAGNSACSRGVSDSEKDVINF